MFDATVRAHNREQRSSRADHVIPTNLFPDDDFAFSHSYNNESNSLSFYSPKNILMDCDLTANPSGHHGS